MALAFIPLQTRSEKIFMSISTVKSKQLKICEPQVILQIIRLQSDTNRIINLSSESQEHHDYGFPVAVFSK